MKFSDHIIRKELTTVYVKRTREEMETREEHNSLLWAYEKTVAKGVHLYSTPVRDVKIGENIYDAQGEFITYRVD